MIRNIIDKIKKVSLIKVNMLTVVLSITGMLLLLAGTTYAIFSDTVTSNKQHVVTSGKIKIIMDEPEEGLNLGAISFMSDVEGLLMEDYYEFNLSNVGDANAKYKLFLLDDPDAMMDYTGLILEDQYIRFGLEKDGEEFGPFNLAEVSNIIDESKLAIGESVNYKLRVWTNFDGLTDEEIYALEGATKFFKIKVVVEQSFEKEYNKTFAYNGSYHEFVAPYNGYYYIELNGANGGNSITTTGGFGANTTGYVYLNKSDKLYIYVGEKGVISLSSATLTSGGYNGGGSAIYNGGSGGGATDIRYFGDYTPTSADLVWNSDIGLNSRIMVAAGGGGAGEYTSDEIGGAGGRLIGLSGGNYSVDLAGGGLGGTQVSGGRAGYAESTDNLGSDGAFGIGGNGSYYDITGSGGGGAGYYGGGGGSSNHGGGGGGSSFISGYAGVNAITSSTNNTHTNNTLHYSGKYFISSSMTSGKNSDNGNATITFAGENLVRNNTKLDNVRYIKDCYNGNSVNTINNWQELQAIYQGRNVAYNKTVTTTATLEGTRLLDILTDGIINHTDDTNISLTEAGLYCVIVDLNELYNLDEIAVWHYPNTTSNEHSIYVSSDNVSWTSLIDNMTTEETTDGVRVSAY